MVQLTYGHMNEYCSGSEDDAFVRFASDKLAGFQSYCMFTHKLVLTFFLIQFNLTQGLLLVLRKLWIDMIFKSL